VRVAEFCRKFSVPWPCGYGVSKGTLENFKAVYPGSPRIMPTLYIIGQDGKIFWHDNHFRLKHAEDKSVLRELETQLAKALADADL
jgi:hypothetical protein